MSTAPDTAAKPPGGGDKSAGKAAKKGAGFARIIATGLTFVAGAAAGGFGGAIGASQFAGGAAAPHAAAPVAPEPVEYVEIDNAFTSNLVDTGRYLQLRLAVSTTGGEAVVAAIALHKPALISTVLAVLGELAEGDIADRPAKDRLRDRLRKAINDVLAAKGVGGGIEDVFLTSLVVQ